MANPNGSRIPAIVLWILMPLSALFLGWSFNVRYFSLSFGGSDGTREVVQTGVVFFVILCALCLFFSFLVTGPGKRRRILVLACAVLFPVLFWATASTTRLMTEKGVIDPTGLSSQIKLEPGQWTMIAGLKLTARGSGVGIENILNTTPVAQILWYHTASQELLTLLAVALLAAVLARLVQVAAKKRTT